MCPRRSCAQSRQLFPACPAISLLSLPATLPYYAMQSLALVASNDSRLVIGHDILRIFTVPSLACFALFLGLLVLSAIRGGNRGAGRASQRVGPPRIFLLSRPRTLTRTQSSAKPPLAPSTYTSLLFTARSSRHPPGTLLPSPSFATCHTRARIFFCSSRFHLLYTIVCLPVCVCACVRACVYIILRDRVLAPGTPFLQPTRRESEEDGDTYTLLIDEIRSANSGGRGGPGQSHCL